ncbi:MAG: InlB B-repeat-containing protein [Lachnospiraceae bacterium]|nr:InlB B-repeat-containing protein [Lachnospiraceae bacterium]MBP5254515.1 InlB B-repeat-containing protein [Lachnospiraceae bacterium]
MKKTHVYLISALIAVLLCGMLVSCQDEPGPAPAAKDVYRVTFFDNFVGGSETVQKIAPGEKVTKPADPSRTGFRFDGWFDAYEGGSAFDFDKAVSADTNVYAHWTKTANLVTFRYNDGKAGTVVTVENGGKVAKPADPVSDVYEFIGWFLDGAYTKEFDFDTAINDSMTIYAGWSKSSVKLTFNLNYNGAPDPVTVNAHVEQPIVLPEGVETVRSLYAFDGWYLKSFPSESDQPYDLTAGVEEDTTLYAKWIRNAYAVEFNPNERSMESVVVEVPVDNPVAVAPEMLREGYTIDEVWYKDAALSAPVDLTNITDDITVYGKWNINHYDVAFDLNYEDAKDAPAAQNVEFQGKLTRPENPSREGYTFTGWFTAKEEGDAFNFEDGVITEDLTLFAQWLSAGDIGGSIKVTFNYNAKSLGLGGATGIYKEVEIESGEALGSARMPEDPALSSNLMFRGWFSDEACTKSFDPSAVLLADTTVYARILVGNVFEAEYVNLADKHGVGSSVELNEEAMIFDYTKIGTGSGEGEEYVSNDYYVAGMYQNGLYIEFEINASRAVENLALSMRVSSEFKELHYNPLTPQTYRIDIIPEGSTPSDDTFFEYELPLTLPLPNTERENDPDGEKTPFQDVIISYKFHLEEGMNYIRFTTANNWNYGAGTFTANAPMIDCITIYADSDVRLDMNEYTEFLEKKQ